MKPMLFDVWNWPKKLMQSMDDEWPNWAPGYCFYGHVVGMFSKGQPYLVGRIFQMQFEDQVYTLSYDEGIQIEFSALVSSHHSLILTLITS